MIEPGPAASGLYAATADAYARRRAEDPRIAAAIRDALAGARTVVNVGAGQGAYEPRDLEVVGGGTVRTVPISHDCRDGFIGAYWRRPAKYLEPEAQQAISSLARLDRAARQRGLARLARDIADGTWATRYAHLLDRTELDLGYRLVLGRHN